MNFEIIWRKIQEFAMWFFHFAMNEGENKFMLVDQNLLRVDKINTQTMTMYFGTFLIVALITIFATDSFHPFNLGQGILMWFKKVSILKVTIFAAAVFSLHTFYKMLILLIENLIGMKASVLALGCLGSYMNPFSVFVLSITASTVVLAHSSVQAFFLGLSVFLTPALLTFNTFTLEHVVIYAGGIAFGVATAALYRRFSMYVTYVVMSVVYLVSKYFMLMYSGKVLLLSANTMKKRGMQYLACMELDVFLIFILALILLGYKVMISEEKDRKIIKDIAGVALIAVVVIGSVVCGKVTEVKAGTPKESPVLFTFGKEKTNKEYSYERAGIASGEASSSMISSDGYTYDITLSMDGDMTTCWQDGVEGTGEGETLTYHLDGEAKIGKIRIANGNRKSNDSYFGNCRLDTAEIHFYLNGNEVSTKTMEFNDDFSQEYTELIFDPVQCDTISIVASSVYQGWAYNDLGVSEVEFYKAVEK